MILIDYYNIVMKSNNSIKKCYIPFFSMCIQTLEIIKTIDFTKYKNQVTNLLFV